MEIQFELFKILKNTKLSAAERLKLCTEILAKSHNHPNFSIDVYLEDERFGEYNCCPIFFLVAQTLDAELIGLFLKYNANPTLLCVSGYDTPQTYVNQSALSLVMNHEKSFDNIAKLLWQALAYNLNLDLSQFNPNSLEKLERMFSEYKKQAQKLQFSSDTLNMISACQDRLKSEYVFHVLKQKLIELIQKNDYPKILKLLSYFSGEEFSTDSLPTESGLEKGILFRSQAPCMDATVIFDSVKLLKENLLQQETLKDQLSALPTSTPGSTAGTNVFSYLFAPLRVMVHICTKTRKKENNPAATETSTPKPTLTKPVATTKLSPSEAETKQNSDTTKVRSSLQSKLKDLKLQYETGFKVLRMLLDKRYKALTPDGASKVFQSAILAGDTMGCELLLKAGEQLQSEPNSQLLFSADRKTAQDLKPIYPVQPLTTAVISNKLDMVKFLLDKGANLFHEDFHQMPLLQVAMYSNWKYCFRQYYLATLVKKMLLETPPSEEDRTKFAALAAEAGKKPKEIVEEFANFVYLSELKKIENARNKNLELLTFLTEKAPRLLFMQDNNNDSPMVVAVTCYYSEALSLILKKIKMITESRDKKERDEDERSMITREILKIQRFYFNSIINNSKILLDACRASDYIDSTFAQAQIHFAVTDVVKLKLNKKFSVLFLQYFQMMLKMGANPNYSYDPKTVSVIKEGNFESAVSTLIFNYQYLPNENKLLARKMLLILKRAKGDFENLTILGDKVSALEYAARNLDFKLCLFLIKNGCNPNVNLNQGTSLVEFCFILASYSDSRIAKTAVLEIIRLALERDVNLDGFKKLALKSQYVVPWLKIAIHNKFNKIAEIFLNRIYASEFDITPKDFQDECYQDRELFLFGFPWLLQTVLRQTNTNSDSKMTAEQQTQELNNLKDLAAILAGVDFKFSNQVLVFDIKVFKQCDSYGKFTKQTKHPRTISFIIDNPGFLQELNKQLSLGQKFVPDQLLDLVLKSSPEFTSVVNKQYKREEADYQREADSIINRLTIMQKEMARFNFDSPLDTIQKLELELQNLLNENDSINKLQAKEKSKENARKRRLEANEKQREEITRHMKNVIEIVKNLKDKYSKIKEEFSKVYKEVSDHVENGSKEFTVKDRTPHLEKAKACTQGLVKLYEANATIFSECGVVVLYKKLLETQEEFLKLKECFQKHNVDDRRIQRVSERSPEELSIESKQEEEDRKLEKDIKATRKEFETQMTIAKALVPEYQTNMNSWQPNPINQRVTTSSAKPKMSARTLVQSTERKAVVERDTQNMGRKGRRSPPEKRVPERTLESVSLLAGRAQILDQIQAIPTILENISKINHPKRDHIEVYALLLSSAQTMHTLKGMNGNTIFSANMAEKFRNSIYHDYNRTERILNPETHETEKTNLEKLRKMARSLNDFIHTTASDTKRSAEKQSLEVSSETEVNRSDPGPIARPDTGLVLTATDQEMMKAINSSVFQQIILSEIPTPDKGVCLTMMDKDMKELQELQILEYFYLDDKKIQLIFKQAQDFIKARLGTYFAYFEDYYYDDKLMEKYQNLRVHRRIGAKIRHNAQNSQQVTFRTLPAYPEIDLSELAPLDLKRTISREFPRLPSSRPATSTTSGASLTVPRPETKVDSEKREGLLFSQGLALNSSFYQTNLRQSTAALEKKTNKEKRSVQQLMGDATSNTGTGRVLDLTGDLDLRSLCLSFRQTGQQQGANVSVVQPASDCEETMQLLEALHASREPSIPTASPPAIYPLDKKRSPAKK